MPCCGQHFHTQCLLGMGTTTAVCPVCSTALIDQHDTATQGSDMMTLGQHMNMDPEFAADVKALRSKLRGVAAARVAMNKAIKEARQSYRDAIQPHVDQIYAARSAAGAALKASPVFKEGKVAQRKTTALRNAFLEKYPLLSWMERYSLFSRTHASRRSHRFSSEPYIFRTLV